METFKQKQLKDQINRIFGNSPQAEEMKQIVLKANTVGFTEEEIKEYQRKKEEDLKMICEFFDPELSKLPLTEESKVIENKIFSNELIGNVKAKRLGFE